MPSITEKFLSKVNLKFTEKPYVFYIATYGATTGANGQMANGILKKKGLCIDAYFDIIMTYDNIYRKTSNLKVTDACVGCGL